MEKEEERLLAEVQARMQQKRADEETRSAEMERTAELRATLQAKGSALRAQLGPLREEISPLLANIDAIEREMERLEKQFQHECRHCPDFHRAVRWSDWGRARCSLCGHQTWGKDD